ncbi:MAG: hypothetical protein U0T81_19245 [Saprospiraceae bacterium]
MGLKTPYSSSFSLPDGRVVTLETGKLGSQADGSALIRCGNTMLFASVVSNKDPREGADFFPYRLIIRSVLLLRVKFLETSSGGRQSYPIMKY